VASETRSTTALRCQLNVAADLELERPATQVRASRLLDP
jgi:hypothetical protein